MVVRPSVSGIIGVEVLVPDNVLLWSFFVNNLFKYKWVNMDNGRNLLTNNEWTGCKIRSVTNIHIYKIRDLGWYHDPSRVSSICF